MNFGFFASSCFLSPRKSKPFDETHKKLLKNKFSLKKYLNCSLNAFVKKPLTTFRSFLWKRIYDEIRKFVEINFCMMKSSRKSSNLFDAKLRRNATKRLVSMTTAKTKRMNCHELLQKSLQNKFKLKKLLTLNN